MGRIENMVAELTREVERLGVQVIHSEVADKRHAVIVTDAPPKQGSVRLSKVLPGCVFIGGSHISWTCSNFAVSIHTAETWERLIPVRIATEHIVGQAARYGCGACARQVVDWLGPADPASPKLRQYIGDWHYQRCKPGLIARAFQFDLSACYFNILKRLPSLHPSFSDDEIFWRVTGDTEAERFGRVLETVQHVKPLRNALIGAMYGGSSQVFLKGGKPTRFTTAPGMRPAIAAAIVRTAFEVCLLQAEISNAAYANADSIISADADAGFWRDIGLPYRLVASGEADVQAIGKYRVGDKATKTFEKGSGGALRIPKECRRVDPVYWRWLTCTAPLLA